MLRTSLAKLPFFPVCFFKRGANIDTFCKVRNLFFLFSLFFLIYIANIAVSMKRIFLFFLLLFWFGSFWGQNLNYFSKSDSLVNQILKLQSTGNTFYNKGIFPSQRGKVKKKEDDNIFFSSIIAFTLQKLKNDLGLQSGLIADSICIGVISNYVNYKNKTGINTYNFWQTNPPKFFPNSKLLSRNDFFNTPDDADDCSIIYLTDTSLHSNRLWLKDKLAKHANTATLKIKSTYKSYRNYKAYSTWFGKNMPVEFDICVESNILYFVYENKLPLNENDSATVALIKSMILSGKYIKDAAFVSASYKKPSIILYHLARLLGKFNIPELNDCREIIKKDIERELQNEPDFMEKVILSTSLIRMGGKPKPLVYPAALEKEMEHFVFFNADIFSPYARPSLKFISKSKVFAIPFYCKAWCLTLLLEYEVERNKP